MKRFRFPKGIRLVHVPFILHDLSPWPQQIARQMEETKEHLGTSKRAQYGYRIENGYAEIYISK